MSNRCYWNAEEDNLLKENYNKYLNNELVALFPGRSFLSIYKRARKLGLYRDKDIEFMNRSICRKSEKSSNWKGGKRKTRAGYIQVLRPEHERADTNGYVMEHIVVFEEATNIKVPLNCCIHHLNGDKKDNRIENLCLMSFAAHTSYHNKKRSRTQ